MNFWFILQPAMGRAEVDALRPFCYLIAAFLMLLAGPNAELLAELAKACKEHELCITYDGGIATQPHIQDTKRAGAGLVDFIIGTALSIFGGHLSLDEVIAACD